MKKYIYLLLILIISHGCSNNTFTINAETNHDEDLNVFLVKLGESNLPVVVDSTKVFEGKFSFTDSPQPSSFTENGSKRPFKNSIPVTHAINIFL